MKATALVQPPGRIILLDAQAHRPVALLPRRPDKSLEQERTDSPPSMRKRHGDRQLRRLVAFAVQPPLVLNQRPDMVTITGQHLGDRAEPKPSL